MSLINEALKRAKQAQAQQAPLARTEPPLEPVAGSAGAGSPPSWLIGAAAVAIFLLGVWFLSLWWHGSKAVRRSPAEPATTMAQNRNSVTPPPAPQPNTTQSIATLPPSPTNAALTTVAAAPPVPLVPTNSEPTIAVTLDAKTSAPVPTPTENQPPEPTPVVPAIEVPLSSFKLQGIFYRASNASALINGLTVFLGDEIDGARIVGIERRAVQLSMGGKTNNLTLR